MWIIFSIRVLITAFLWCLWSPCPANHSNWSGISTTLQRRPFLVSDGSNDCGTPRTIHIRTDMSLHYCWCVFKYLLSWFRVEIYFLIAGKLPQYDSHGESAHRLQHWWPRSICLWRTLPGASTYLSMARQQITHVSVSVLPTRVRCIVLSPDTNILAQCADFG